MAAHLHTAARLDRYMERGARARARGSRSCFRVGSLVQRQAPRVGPMRQCAQFAPCSCSAPLVLGSSSERAGAQAFSRPSPVLHRSPSSNRSYSHPRRNLSTHQMQAVVKPGCSRARIVPWLVSSAKLLRIAAAQPACLSPSSGRPRTFEAARGAFRCSHLFIAISLLLPEWNSLRSQHVAHRQPYNAGQDPNAIRTQDDWNFASPPCYLLCLQ